MIDFKKRPSVNGKPLALLEELESNKFIVVDVLPPVEEAKFNYVYLIKCTHEEASDCYDEYILTQTADGTLKFEKIGNTDIDLTDYIKVAADGTITNADNTVTIDNTKDIDKPVSNPAKEYIAAEIAEAVDPTNLPVATNAANGVVRIADNLDDTNNPACMTASQIKSTLNGWAQFFATDNSPSPNDMGIHGKALFASQNDDNGGLYIGGNTNGNVSWTQWTTRYQRDRIRAYGNVDGQYEDFYLEPGDNVDNQNNTIARKKDIVAATPDATSTIKGLVKLGTDAAVTGAPVGVNADGKLTVGEATATALGTVKLSTSYTIQNGSTIGVNANGQLSVPLASSYYAGVVKVCTNTTQTLDQCGWTGRSSNGELLILKPALTGTEMRFGAVRIADNLDDTNAYACATAAQVKAGLVAEADARNALEERVNANTTAIDTKATKATTIAGYGITDAYTKAEVEGKLTSSMHYKGTKATVAALPTSGNTIGDVWNVSEDGSNYAWDGSSWDKLSGVVDLSGYATNAALNDGLAEKAALEHTHEIIDTVGLQAALDGKAAATHTHSINQVSGLQGTLDGKAAVKHLHNIADVANLAEELDTKVAASGNNTFSGTNTFDENVILKEKLLFTETSGGVSISSSSGDIFFNSENDNGTTGASVRIAIPYATSTTENLAFVSHVVPKFTKDSATYASEFKEFATEYEGAIRWGQTVVFNNPTAFVGFRGEVGFEGPVRFTEFVNFAERVNFAPQVTVNVNTNTEAISFKSQTTEYYGQRIFISTDGKRYLAFGYVTAGNAYPLTMLPLSATGDTVALISDLTSKADTGHTHAIADITDLQTKLTSLEARIAALETLVVP